MRIKIETIDGNSQRFPTLGDFFYKDKDILNIKVTKLNNPDYEFLVAIHELVEWYLTESKGIHEHDILKFDIQFEKDREKGLHTEDAEPGDHDSAPYKKMHRFAENIERLVAHELGIDFNKYNQDLMDFVNGKPNKINPKIGK